MKKERWVVSAKRADFQAIADRFGIDPVIARLIRNRDVTGEKEIEEYLFGDLEQLHDPLLMKDMERAADLIAEKIREKKPIRIIGDYDIDGVTATYILLTGLKDLGADVDVRIPDRIADGYGLNEHLVQFAVDEGRDTIVTCDNGIAASSQIRLAKELGMTVVVTDHHEVPFEEDENGERRYILPPADAVVNPKQKDCSYPFPGLCGAAVAWKLIQAMEAKAGIPKEHSFRFLEFVAIATIGDVMDLQGENRILVKAGLRALHKTQNLGLQELIRVQGIEAENVTPYHIGFVLGPCINASGRLDTAEHSLKLLCAKTREEAAKLAGDLKDLNESRKELTRQGVNYANPAVFVDMTKSILHLANLGVEVFRIDAVPYIWKQLGTNCRNLPQVHTIVRMLRMVLEVVCPAVILKGEVVMAPKELAAYFGTPEKPECHMLYNVSTMVNLWSALASRDTRLLKAQLDALHALPDNCWFVNYLRCHDDIGWGLDEAVEEKLGIDPQKHKEYLYHFYEGNFPGSWAKGELYNYDPATGDARSCGTTASLCGVEQALEKNDTIALDYAVKRDLLLHTAMAFLQGFPMLLPEKKP